MGPKPKHSDAPRRSSPRQSRWLGEGFAISLGLATATFVQEDAIEQAMAVFERAADRLTADGVFVTDSGVLAVEAWKESDRPPEPYVPSTP